MADKKPQRKPQVPAHEHELSQHDHEHEHPHAHDLAQHAHPHEHEVGRHEHEVGRHEHPPQEEVPKHDHRELLGHLRGAVRALLVVLETGTLNSEQLKAIHQVRVIIGDAHGRGCSHPNVAYEEGDALVCQDCREILPSPDVSG